MANNITPDNIKELIIWLQPFVEDVKYLKEYLKESLMKNDAMHDSHRENIKVLETTSRSIQIELTEHKQNHWRMIAIILTAAGIIGGIIGFAIKAL